MFWFHIPSEGKRTEYEQWFFKVMGCKAGLPDLFFLEPNEQYSGLVIEFKTANPYKLNGECKFPAQEKELIRLRERGYLAEFCWEYDEVKKIIEIYFDL